MPVKILAKTGPQPGALTEGAEITDQRGGCQWGMAHICVIYCQIYGFFYRNLSEFFLAFFSKLDLDHFHWVK